MPPNQSTRLIHLDAAKGLCILLMIIGHTHNIDAEIYKHIYSFHMPAFFIIAGMTYSRKSEPIAYLTFQKFKRLILPAWALGGICAIPFALKLTRGTITPEEFTSRLVGTLVGAPSANSTFDSTPLWFLHCIFWVYVSTFLTERANASSRGAIAAKVALLTGLVYLSADYTAPAQFKYLVSGSLFFGIGQLVTRFRDTSKFPRWGNLLASLVFLLCWEYAVGNAGTTQMNLGNLGPQSTFPFSFISGICGSFGLILFLTCIPNPLGLQYLPEISLPIVGLNYLIEGRVNVYLDNPTLALVDIVLLVGISVLLSNAGKIGALFHGRL